MLIVHPHSDAVIILTYHIVKQMPRKLTPVQNPFRLGEPIYVASKQAEEAMKSEWSEPDRKHAQHSETDVGAKASLSWEASSRHVRVPYDARHPQKDPRRLQSRQSS